MKKLINLTSVRDKKRIKHSLRNNTKQYEKQVDTSLILDFTSRRFVLFRGSISYPKLALTLSTILIFGFLTVSAQAPKIADWKTFAPGNEEFSVSLPGSPEVFDYEEKDENSEIFYKHVSQGTYFLISSGKDIKSFDEYNLIKQLAKENKAKSENKIIGSFQGEKLSFTDSENFHQTILIVKGTNRFYIFHTVSEVEGNPLTERFFSSLKFDKNPPTNETIPEQETKVTNNQNSPDGKMNKLPVGGGSGMGTGNGSGNVSGGVGGKSGAGNSSGNSNSPIAPKGDGQISGLKILSKPKPPYTDLARYYWIAGEVRLRMIFKADGTIGTISPVTKLPFGLTDNAIKAASAMRFEPAMRDGVPYAVVKQVVYNFTIY